MGFVASIARFAWFPTGWRQQRMRWCRARCRPWAVVPTFFGCSSSTLRIVRAAARIWIERRCWRAKISRRRSSERCRHSQPMTSAEVIALHPCRHWFHFISGRRGGGRIFVALLVVLLGHCDCERKNIYEYSIHCCLQYSCYIFTEYSIFHFGVLNIFLEGSTPHKTISQFYHFPLL